MAHAYSTFSDDFYVNVRLGSQMSLPNQRETVLHFMEQMQKAYPTMQRFRKGDGPDFSLEEDRASGSYRWMSLEPSRLSAGHVNPDDLENAYKLHKFVLDMAPYELGISNVEVDYLDVLFGFDLSFGGNHDEIVAESLFEGSPLACLLDIPGAKPVDFQPTMIVALSDDVRLQARIEVVTRTSSYQVRTGEYSEDSISVYLVVRRFWGDRPKQSFSEIFATLAERGEQLVSEYVLPRVVRPIRDTISSRS
jgi:hypothetical protein